MKTLLSILFLFALISCTKESFETDAPEDAYYLCQIQNGEVKMLCKPSMEPYYFMFESGKIYRVDINKVECGQYTTPKLNTFMAFQIVELNFVVVSTFNLINTEGHIDCLYSTDLMFVYTTLDPEKVSQIFDNWVQ